MPPVAVGPDFLQGPDYDMRNAGPDLLVAAGAAIGLRARLPGQMAHPEIPLDVLVPARPLLGQRGICATLVLPGHTTSLMITLNDRLMTAGAVLLTGEVAITCAPQVESGPLNRFALRTADGVPLPACSSGSLPGPAEVQPHIRQLKKAASSSRGFRSWPATRFTTTLSRRPWRRG